MANLSNINGKFVVEQTTGYVGVGTTDPNYPIEVLNASAEIALNASGGSIYILRSDSTDSFRIIKNDVGDRLVIDSSGNSTFAGNVAITGSVTANTGSKITSSSTDTTFSIETTSGTTIFPVLDFVTSHSSVGGQIRQGGTKVIGFDKSLNSTFAGSIMVNGDGIDIDNNDNLRLRFDNASVFKAGLQVATSTGDMITSSVTNDFAIRSQSNMLFATGGSTERMRIDSSGNVGIGGSPNDWDPTITALQIDAVSISAFTNNVMLIGGNAYYDDTANAYKYINNGYASQLTVNNSGNFEFKTAASGTAGGTVSLDTKVKILNNGNVGIGTSLPQGKLDVATDSSTASAIKTLVLGGGTGVNGNGQYIQFRSSANVTLGSQIAGTRVGAGAASDLRFSTTDGSSVVRERMRITSSGVVQVENTGAAHLILNGDTNNTGDVGNVDGIIDFRGDGNPGPYGYRINTENWSGQTALNFQEYINGSYTSRLFISKEGKVGIGIDLPEQKLHVVGNIKTFGNILLQSNANGFRTVALDTANGADNQELYLCGGGTASSTRGGQVGVYGNEVSGTGGSVVIVAGNVSTGDIDFLTANTQRMIINNAGNVSIGTTNNGSKLNVGGTIAAATNNGASGMIVPRSYNIAHGGATFTHTFNPVTLFGQQTGGGQVLFECTGWQMAMNNGYIMWRNAGGSDPIGANGSVQYVQTAYVSGAQSGSNTIAVSLNGVGSNDITITFTGWHGNGHGFMCRITTNYS